MKKIGKYTFFWKDKIAHWNMQSFRDEKGIEYLCVEQYMMAQKAILFKDTETYNKIMKATDPSEHQKIGREIKAFNQKIWDENKEKIVYDGNYFKFTQNPELLAILLSTKGTELVEASPFDEIWGIAMDVDNPDITDKTKWKGQNLLGKLLTQLRDDLGRLEETTNV